MDIGRFNYLTIVGLILSTTGAARFKACTAGLYLPNTGIVGGSPTWRVGVQDTSVFVSRVVVQALQRSDLQSQSYQTSANKIHKPGKRKTLNFADL